MQMEFPGAFAFTNSFQYADSSKVSYIFIFHYIVLDHFEELMVYAKDSFMLALNLSQAPSILLVKKLNRMCP